MKRPTHNDAVALQAFSQNRSDERFSRWCVDQWPSCISIRAQPRPARDESGWCRHLYPI